MFEVGTSEMNVENENREARAIFIFSKSFHHSYRNSNTVDKINVSRRHHNINICMNVKLCQFSSMPKTEIHTKKAEKNWVKKFQRIFLMVFIYFSSPQQPPPCM